MNEIHIPTISGATNVLSMDITKESTKKEFKTVLQQQDDLAQIDANGVQAVNEFGTVTYQKFGAGLFAIGFPVGSFLTAQTILTIVNNQFEAGVGTYIAEYSVVNDFISLQIIDAETQVSTDAKMNQCNVSLEVFADLSTDALVFAEMLSRLDANQTKIWSKIVIRNGAIITEVDGNKYRRTNSFVQSSKVINS